MESPTWFGILLTISLHSYCVVSQDVQCGSSGACYRYVSEPRTYLDAVGVCQGYGGSLVSVTNSNLQSELQSMMSSFGAGQTWLRATPEEPMENYGYTWRWVSDGSVVGPQGCYKDDTNAPDFPNEVSIPSSQMDPQACETACQANFVYYAVQNGNRCFCSNSYGRYAHVNTDIDNVKCVTECSGTIGSLDKVYCGGPARNFIYSVGGAFASWAYTKPNNFDGYQTCAVIHKWDKSKFDDEECFDAYYYMCELPTAGSCSGQSGTTIDNKCVFFSDSVIMKSWYEARDDCVNRGGDLLKIENEAFRLLIKTALSTKPGQKWWIGLTNRQWNWKSNDPVVYVNWASAEPNRIDYKCMGASSSRSYKWEDYDCASTVPFLCLTTAPTTTPRPTTTTTTPTTTPSPTTPTPRPTTPSPTTRPTTTPTTTTTKQPTTPSPTAVPTTTTAATTTTTRVTTTTNPTTTTTPKSNFPTTPPSSTTTTTRLSSTSTTARPTSTPTMTSLSSTATTKRVSIAPSTTRQPRTSSLTSLSSTTTTTTPTPTTRPSTTRSTTTTATTTTTRITPTTTTTRKTTISSSTIPTSTTTPVKSTTTTRSTAKTDATTKIPSSTTTAPLQVEVSTTSAVIGNSNKPDTGGSGESVPRAGASTGDSSSSLGTTEIVLIITSCVLLGFVLLLVISVAYYKRVNGKNKVQPDLYDGRQAPYAYAGSAEQAYYTSSENGSQVGLVPNYKRGDQNSNRNTRRIDLDDD